MVRSCLPLSLFNHLGMLNTRLLLRLRTFNSAQHRRTNGSTAERF